MTEILTFSLCVWFRLSAIIITASLNDASNLRLLSSFAPEWVRQEQEQEQEEAEAWGHKRQHTKILLIDMVASSLDVEHRFYKYLTRIGRPERKRHPGRNLSSQSGMVSSSLLVLTLLSDRHRNFLNAAGLMATMQNFRTPNGGGENGSHAEPSASGHHNFSVGKLYPYRNLLPLYDLVASTATQSGRTEAIPKYDFVVLDIVRDVPLAIYKWRPLLILESDKRGWENGSAGGGAAGSYITHSVQPGYDEWLLVSSVQLWQCGAICWTIVAICVGLLVIIVAASVAAGIAMR